MANYRTQLPQFDGGIYLTDGGLETVLEFTYGILLDIWHKRNDESAKTSQNPDQDISEEAN